METREKTEITDEMVRAGAEVLWRDPFAGISESVAEEMTRKILAAALSARLGRNASNDLEALRPPLDGPLGL